jgi:hypothetical protein
LRVNTTPKRLGSGLLWIIVSPFALLMALIAKGGSETEYHIVVVACGTWSACGVVSGVGTIVGSRWAIPVQTTLCWIAFALLCLIPAAILLFNALKVGMGYFALVALAMLLTVTPLLVRARRRQNRGST